MILLSNSLALLVCASACEVGKVPALLLPLKGVRGRKHRSSWSRAVSTQPCAPEPVAT
jgi:hypothetical protein